MERNRRDGLGCLYFSCTPLRSFHFWVNTLLLILIAWTAVFFRARFGSYLNAKASASMMVPVVVMAVLWFRLLRLHPSVRKEYADSLASDADQDTVEYLIDSLAYISYPAFTLALTAVASVYFALG